MSKIVFVTGTDTGVGKTVVSCLVAKKLRENGWDVAVAKPVETGCTLQDDGMMLASDAALLKQFSKTDQSLDDICPLRFQAALAPAVAIKQSSVDVNVSEICAHLRKQSSTCDILLVEGAGGLLVPILDDFTFADLATELQMQVVLVVASKLGALNAASLSFEVIRGRNLQMLGYVFNDLYAATEQEDESIKTNRDALKQIANRYEISEIGYLENISELQQELTPTIEKQVEEIVKSITSSICHD